MIREKGKQCFVMDVLMDHSEIRNKGIAWGTSWRDKNTEDQRRGKALHCWVHKIHHKSPFPRGLMQDFPILKKENNLRTLIRAKVADYQSFVGTWMACPVFCIRSRWQMGEDIGWLDIDMCRIGRRETGKSVDLHFGDIRLSTDVLS